jgi:hypothetical protein
MILRKLAVALLTLWLLALAALIVGSLTGCTQVTVTPPAAEAPAFKAGQLGGHATITHGETSITVDNVQSFTDATKMVSSITTAITALKGTIALLDMRKAKNAADAATEGAKIAAGTQSQQIAADQALGLKQLDNEAAAAALEAQQAP